MTGRARPGVANRSETAEWPEAAERPAGSTSSAATAIYQSRQMLQLAHWAAGAFATYDRASVLRIADAVARVAHANAAKYAEWAVRETGFGVVEHKTMKNEACSLGVLDRYRDDDFVSPRVDAAAKILAVPRPAGVVLALAPSTNPISSVYFKVILALLTRNAVVVSPHPMAKECCADAARLLAATAEQAGAPAGAIQVVSEPTVPLIEALMSDPVTDVIVATGGTAVVRAAHRSGTPALGVGPGNVPVLVDATADLRGAAKMIADSKAFDNSVLCTNESVLVVQEAVAAKLLRELKSHQAVVLDDPARDQVRAYLFPDGRLNGEAIGKDAAWIADRAGLRVPARTRVLLAPIDMVVSEEPFAREKLCPVLAVTRTESPGRGIDTARALAPSMTLGTGYVGRSSVGENLEPRHLVNWTRVAYNSDANVPFGNFAGISAWEPAGSAVPAYPRASNEPSADVDRQRFLSAGPGASGPDGDDEDNVAMAVREQLRALIIQELEHLMRA